MTRVTVVIEDHAEGIHLGQQLAGGRVVAALQGDHSELLSVVEKAAEHLEPVRRRFIRAERFEEEQYKAGSDLYLLLDAAITKARGQ